MRLSQKHRWKILSGVVVIKAEVVCRFAARKTYFIQASWLYVRSDAIVSDQRRIFDIFSEKQLPVVIFMPVKSDQSVQKKHISWVFNIMLDYVTFF